MQTKLLYEHAGQRTFAIVFGTDEEAVSGLLDFARRQTLTGSHFAAIGAFRTAVIAYFEWETREYERIPVDEQVEVLSLIGDVTVTGGEPKLHAHVVLGRRDGTALGGHLMQARVRPTLEVILTESPAHLQRTMDQETGLPLITMRA